MKQYSLILCLSLLLLTAGIPAASASSAFASACVTAVSPLSWPNGGVATLTITGKDFDDTSTTWLVKCGQDGGGGGYISGTIISLSPTQVVATYNLANAKVGMYSVRVKTLDSISGYTEGELYKGFEVYKASGATGTTATTTTTSVPTSAATIETGSNSVFFETNPTGATILVDGVEVGTSAFTYNTNKDGVHDVLVKKIGYDDYSDRVTIVDNNRVRFYAQLTPLSSGSATTTTVTSAATAKPLTNVTTTRKSTLKVPTPLGTDPPVTEEAPMDPALALWAAGIGIAVVVSRRR